MLKTNSKKAIENIKNYIMNNYTPDSYGEEAESKTEFQDIARYILSCAKHELAYLSGRVSDEVQFTEWCKGLPSLLDTCYYYNRSAVEDLGNILEETEEERNRYSEEQAEMLLTHLIFRELDKAR